MLHHHPVAGRMGRGNCLIPNSISICVSVFGFYGFRKTLIFLKKNTSHFNYYFSF